MVRSKLSRLFPVVAASAGALALAACGGGGTTPAAGSSTPSTTPSPTSTTVTAATSAPSTSAPATAPPVAQPADNGLCKAGDVKLSLGQGDAGAGSTYRPLLITNSGSKPCLIQGFPGVSYVAGTDGHQVGKDAFREGTKGNAVKLDPGQTAAADIQFVNVRNYDPGTCQPTAVKGLRIYLPQETASNFVPAEGTGCASTKIPGNQLSVKTVHVG
jgi:ABC-type transport system substrate-binding protein